MMKKFQINIITSINQKTIILKKHDIVNLIIVIKLVILKIIIIIKIIVSNIQMITLSTLIINQNS